MTHIDSIVAWMLAQQGKPYWNKDDRRFGPNMFDCSGIHVAAWRATGTWYPSWATWSGGQLRWGREQGTKVSSAEARSTYGAVCVRGGEGGTGNNGHIATSLGDGRTMEAMGTAYGCRIGNFDGRFQDFFRVPGVTYRDQAPPKPPIDWAAIGAAVRLRRTKKMWLIRDSRTGGIYVYDGIHARHLDGETVKIQTALMSQMGLPTAVYNQQDYLIDRLREQSCLIG